MSAVLAVLAFVVAAVGMEGVAWATHKYVMHGFLWLLHRDHHQPKGRGWQKNDLFALLFASLSFVLILIGTLRGVAPVVAAGLGVALYGVGYLAFHDIMFHKRLRRVRLRPSTPYLQRIYDAHARHHRHPRRENGVSFGFLYAARPRTQPDQRQGRT